MFIFLVKFFFYFFGGDICILLHLCLSATCVPGDLRGQKGVSDPLNLELEVPMSCHVGASKETHVLWERSQCSETLSHLSSLDKVFRYG